MPDLSELRKELREMRKTHAPAVSRMRKGDISKEIDMLRGRTEETPHIANTPSVPDKKIRAAVESIKEAKKSEFPVKPIGKKEGRQDTDPMYKAEQKKLKMEAKGETVKRSAPKAEKKAKLMKMLAEMSDSD
jgi:hypothetical protein